ncbi:MAG: hypothetical protein ACOX5Z_02475 [Desulfobulbus sp.]|jgi:phage protein D
MPLPRPACTITVDGLALTGAQAALRLLDAELSLENGHDRVRLDCGPASPLQQARCGALCTLTLGYGDDKTAVFSGEVDRVEQGLHGVGLEMLAPTIRLSRWFGAQTYQEQTVAGIVRDLVTKAGVPTATIAADATVSIWHVDERRSAWWHINRLAALGDYELLCEPSGALSLRSTGSGGRTHTLRHGADILALSAAEQTTSDSRRADRSGAGSELGSDKWHIVLRDPAPGEAVRIEGALRTRDAAQTMSKAMQARRERAGFTGRVLTLGSPIIRPGDSAELAGLPEGGTVRGRIVELRHRFDAAYGFTTLLSLGGCA